MFKIKNINQSDFNYLLSIASKSNMTDYLKNKKMNIWVCLKLAWLIIKYKFMKNIYHAAGIKEYADTKFLVNKKVLVPRNETELLIDYVANTVEKEQIPLNFLDIGTGSGAIAITLNKKFPTAKIDAFDISKGAIKVAKKNNFLNKTNVNFFVHDLNEQINKKYNIIVSNPPYIATKGWVDQNVVRTEPHIALFGGESGIDFYKKIIEIYAENITVPGLIAFEVGEKQARVVKQLIINRFPASNVIIKKDFNNIERFVISIIK